MARCPKCRRHFRTLEDEEGMHACPYCDYWPHEEQDEPESEEEEESRLVWTEEDAISSRYPGYAYDLNAAPGQMFHLLPDEAEWNLLIAAVESGEVGADTTIDVD